MARDKILYTQPGKKLHKYIFDLNVKFIGTKITLYLRTNTTNFMNTNNQVGFISEKIRQLQTAILRSHSNCLLKFPNAIATTLEVDNVGCVWITVPKPTQYLHEFDRSFQVDLHYFKKGTPFYLHIYGVARLVIDPEEINHLSPVAKSAIDHKTVLVAVRILTANYYQTANKTTQNTLVKWKQSLVSLFTGESGYHQFNMSPEKSYA